jgi:PhzF family phenazine biosynthesis protein
MRTRTFAQVDVFSSAPYRGNPVAVVMDATGLDDAEMALFAQWTNLSETTFILPPTTSDADYRLRIFTPAGELPFAGHPTLGSAHAWLSDSAGEAGRAGGGDRVVQECGAGLVTIRRDGDALFFAAPPTVRCGPLDEDHVTRIADAFGIPRDAIIDHQWVDNGPGWAGVQLATAAEVLALRPEFGAFPDAVVGVIGAYPAGSDSAFEVRAFAPGAGVPEDPVTGSLNASLAQWLIGAGRAPDRYRVSQGTVIGRAGEVDILREDDGQVWVGGACRTLISGSVIL